MSWFQRLVDPTVKLSHFSEDAKHWNRCAVGEVRASVEYTPGGMPKDPKLLFLGKRFYREVRHNRRRAALRIYLQIQRRVLYLVGIKAA